MKNSISVIITSTLIGAGLKMKKWISILVLCMVVLSFTACAGGVSPGANSDSSVDPQSVAESTPVFGATDSGTPKVILDEETDGMVIGEVSKARMEWQSISRLYSYYIPSTFSGKRMPIMLALHGSGGNADIQMDAGNYAEIAEREGFIVIAPNAVAVLPVGDDRATYRNFSAEGLTMYDLSDVYGDLAMHYVRPAVAGTDPAVQAGIDDPGFYKALIDFYCENGFADKNRVFATGHSHGGFMALSLAYKYSDVYAGVAAVSALVLGELRGVMPPENQVKLVFINSSNDTTVSPTGMIYDSAIAPPDGIWGIPLDEGIALFMEGYGLGKPVETDSTRLDTLSEYDTTRITRIEYNNGAAIKYWITGKDYVTGGVGHAWPGSPSDSTSFSQYQASELFWPDLKIELLEEKPSANIANNELTISVLKLYDNGKQDIVAAKFPITGNVVETFAVDDCRVYVVTRGTDVIECRLEA